MPSRQKLMLQSTFGYETFKPMQEQIINEILTTENNVLGIMPTGGGKSLCFQIPALLSENLTIVVSPLIALMKDQIDNLKQHGIKDVYCYNSSIQMEEKEKIEQKLKVGNVKILYVAPESLQNHKLISILSQIKIDLLVIDEAHCISTWGHCFRPTYLKINDVRKQIGNPQVLALTATATKEVEEDIQKQLEIECKVFKASFDRPNLHINVIQVEKKKDDYIVQLMKTLKGPTLIFVRSRSAAACVCELLEENNHKVTFYHAGLPSIERNFRQNEFINGKVDVIVATVAFGMGIDKSNIRNVIHYNISQSIENYYQEIGRAGRDGQLSKCISLFTNGDIVKTKKLIASEWPDEAKIKEVVKFLSSKNSTHVFTSNYEMRKLIDVHEVPLRLIMFHLEKEGFIRYYSNVEHIIKLDYNFKIEEIIEKAPEHKESIKKIFSSLTEKRKILYMEDIMNNSQLPFFEVVKVFRYLNKEGYIFIEKSCQKELIVKKGNLRQFDTKPLVDIFTDILVRNQEKVDKLSDCLTGTDCIRKEILKYFDETLEKDNCSMCSNCT